MSPHEGGLHPRFISARKRAHNARRGSIIFRYPHLVRGWPRQGRPAKLFQASTPRPRGHLSRDVGTGPKMRGSIMQRLHYEADTSQRGNRLGSSGASGRGTGKAPSIGEPAPDHASASVSDCSHRPIFVASHPPGYPAWAETTRPPTEAALFGFASSPRVLGNVLLHGVGNHVANALANAKITKAGVKLVGRKGLLQLQERVSGRRCRFPVGILGLWPWHLEPPF
jgi:hypothetical protein